MAMRRKLRKDQKIRYRATIPAARIEAKWESRPVKLVVGSLKILRRLIPRVAGLNPERYSVTLATRRPDGCRSMNE